MNSTSITKTIITFSEFIELLCKIQESIWDDNNPVWLETDPTWKRSDHALETYKSLYSNWKPISYDTIEYQLRYPKVELNFSQWGNVIYLPPLKKDSKFVPILSPYCILNETQSIARLQVMLVRRGNNTDEDKKPHGLGFRLETPENMNQAMNSTGRSQNMGANNDIGMHDFHHAQLIHRFRHEKLDLLNIYSLPWLPQSQPSFPLPAKCPITLLLCLIVTLYGGKSYMLFFNKYKSAITGIESYLGKLKLWIDI